MERREILFCNIIVLDGKIKRLIEKVVLLDDETVYKERKSKNELKIISKEIIKSLGFENKSTGYTEAIKSDEKRNNITGAYD